MTQKLRILFAASRLPSRLSTGDRLRAYYLIHGLVQRGHMVDLLGFENLAEPIIETDIYSICRLVRPVHFKNVDFNQRSKRMHIQNLLVGAQQGFPRHVWQFHAPGMLKTFGEMISRTDYDVIHFSELGIAELLYTYAAQINSATIFDLIDAVSMSVRSSLRYRFDVTWPTRLLESFQLRVFEHNLLKHVDASIVVSPVDRAYLGAPEHCYTIPIGIDVPEHPSVAEQDIDLVFVGNMAAEANEDAVKWFTKAVWPIICDVRPATTFWIVGRDPSASVRRLAGGQLVVTGAVEDVHSYLARANVAVAPVRFGAGQKIKLLEAFAHRLPVVATTEASRGIDIRDGQHMLVRDDAMEMAQAILDLLDNEEKRRSIGKAAYELVRSQYSWECSVLLLEDVYARSIRRRCGRIQLG